MKKSVYLFLMLFALSFSVGTLNSCREDKSAGEKMEEGMDDAEDSMEETGDEIEDAAEDAGDEMEDAVDDN